MVHLILRGALLLALFVASVRPAQAQNPPHTPPDSSEVFLQAWNIVRTDFFDPALNGVNWDAVRLELLPRAAKAGPRECSLVINDALSRLHASHTTHYTQDERAFYEVSDIFRRNDPAHSPPPVTYVGIGVATQARSDRVFAADVYDTGPAALAGLHVGDELLSVDGGPWGDVAPFRNKEGTPFSLRIRRRAGAEPMDLIVTPRAIQPRELFLAAAAASARVIQAHGARIAYMHLRSYAGEWYQAQLTALLEGEFATADALILDFRGEWGGASPDYMAPFNPAAPTLVQTPRDQAPRTVRGSWCRPIILVIDSTVRSGKEILAYSMKKHHVATLVGERTAGAVLGGSLRTLHDGSIMMVAVADVTVDGVRLEGVGVEPDIPVARTLEYCDGDDLQLDAAIKAAGRAVEQSRHSP